MAETESTTADKVTLVSIKADFNRRNKELASSDLCGRMNDLIHQYKNKKREIMGQYNDDLDKFQLANPNIPVYEVWKRYGGGDVIKLRTFDKARAEQYKSRPCRHSPQLTVRKLRQLEIYEIKEMMTYI
jgi:hypothetical protein